jgi:quercetin dioxygenase-like cupin family protein
MTRNWKRMLRFVLIVAAAVCLSATVANWAKAQDRATIVPGMKVLFENDCVRVQYHDVAVGGKVPMHSHPAYIVYTLKAFKARITLPDGTQRVSEHQAGEAYWNPPIRHSVENLGNSDIHNLIVELKPGGKCQ